jgi:hypothetical protein
MPRMFNAVMRVISSLIGVLIGTMMGQMEADSSDADLQNDPKQLPASLIFIQLSAESAGQLGGSRFYRRRSKIDDSIVYGRCRIRLRSSALSTL